MNESQNSQKTNANQGNELLANAYDGRTGLGRAQITNDGIGLVIQVGNWTLATASEAERQRVGAVIAKEAQQMLSKMPQDENSQHGVRVKMTTDQFGDTSFTLIPGKSAKEAYDKQYAEGPGSKTTDDPKSCPVWKGQPVNQVTMEQFGKMFGVGNLKVRADAGQPDSESVAVASNASSFHKSSEKTDNTEKTASASLGYAFDFDKAKPNVGDLLLNDLSSRSLKLGDRQIDNPYGDSVKKIVESLQSPDYTPAQKLDTAAALVSAWNDKMPENIIAGHGRNGHAYLADGTHEASRMIGVNIKDSEGAAQKLFDSVISKSQEPTPIVAQAAPTQEPETRKQSTPSLT
jgi:hypothetical protein